MGNCSGSYAVVIVLFMAMLNDAMLFTVIGEQMFLAVISAACTVCAGFFASMSIRLKKWS